jgi:hypothetical protein
MAKLKDNDIKKKIRATFGEYQVYNAIEINTLNELTKLISENAQTVQLENGNSDIEITNTIQIMRYMLIHLTNIEEEWNSIDDIKLEEMLNLANGDFKRVVNSLIDIMIEIGNDITIQNIRKLDILQNKLNEMIESVKVGVNIEKTLSNLGLNMDELVKLQNGDKETTEKFQNNIIKSIEKNTKPKRQYNRKKK